MSEISDTPQQDLKLVQRFLMLGVFAGGFVPLSVVAVLNGTLFFMHRTSSMFGSVTDLIYFSLSAGGFACLVTCAYVLQYVLPHRNLRATSLIAGFSWLFLNLFVLQTGGPFGSVFSFHYLYIPTVVASGFFDRWTMRVTTGAYLLSFIVVAVIYWFSPHPSQMNVHTIGYCGSYVIVFVIQLLLAVHLAQEGREQILQAEEKCQQLMLQSRA